jgi:hypothetical protein
LLLPQLSQNHQSIASIIPYSVTIQHTPLQPESS